MDEVEFFKTTRRIYNSNTDSCASEIVAAVEKWAKEHPAKTRQSEFLKVIPNAPMRIPGNVLDVCPNEVDATQSCPTSTKTSDQTLDICYLCKKAYWLTEVD